MHATEKISDPEEQFQVDTPDKTHYTCGFKNNCVLSYLNGIWYLCVWALMGNHLCPSMSFTTNFSNDLLLQWKKCGFFC